MNNGQYPVAALRAKRLFAIEKCRYFSFYFKMDVECVLFALSNTLYLDHAPYLFVDADCHYGILPEKISENRF
jgi:hypothetical protein